VGGDPIADLLLAMLDAEGVRVVGGSSPGRPPTTALLSTTEGVAMATALGEDEPAVEDVAQADAAAVIISLGRVELVPTEARRYLVTGGLELPRIDEGALSRMIDAAAFIANGTEASTLTGAHDPEQAARALARRGTVA